jgi:hypothetical protein
VLWHQKSIVRDDRAVAVMSCNLNVGYYTVIRGWTVVTNGPATAAGVEATFNADFSKTHRRPTPGVVPKGSELIWSPGATSRLVTLIGSARPGTTLYAEDEQLQSTAIEQALVAAAKRGVTVDLTMTYCESYVSGFNTLVAGGVHVSLYPVGAPDGAPTGLTSPVAPRTIPPRCRVNGTPEGTATGAQESTGRPMLHGRMKRCTWRRRRQGANGEGQLGLGDRVGRDSPTRVGHSTKWTKIAAGNNFDPALISSGSFWGWGDSDSGALGLGDVRGYVLKPTRIVRLR